MPIRAQRIARGGRVGRRPLLLLGAAAMLVGGPAFAARKIARIGFIGRGSRQSGQNVLDGFRDGLATLGWAEDGDVALLERWADDHAARLAEIARELIDAGAQMLGVGDPVGAGIVSSLAQPGGNATGLSLSSGELIAKRFELLQQLVPGLRRVAVIARNDLGLEQRLLDIRNIAERMDIKVVEFVAATGRALELAFRWLRSDRYDALYVASGPLGPAKRAEIIALANGARLPAVYAFTVFAGAGGLMAFAADENDEFRRAARFVERILNGAQPADLPVEPPTRFELAINVKTAQSLGLSIPPSLLAQASEIVE